MARSNTPSIKMDPGDEPRIESIGGYQFVLVDGTFRHPELTFDSIAEVDRWHSFLGDQIVKVKDRIAAAVSTDEQYDAAIYGEEPAA